MSDSNGKNVGAWLRDIGAQRLMTFRASNLAAVLCLRGFHIHIQATIKHLFQRLRLSYPNLSIAIASISSWVPCSHCPCWLCLAWEQYVSRPAHPSAHTTDGDILATQFRRHMLRSSYLLSSMQRMRKVPEQVRRAWTYRHPKRKLLTSPFIVWQLE